MNIIGAEKSAILKIYTVLLKNVGVLHKIWNKNFLKNKEKKLQKNV